MRHTIARAAHLLGTARFLLGRCEDVLAGVRGFRMPESDPSWEELGKAWEHRAGEAIPTSWSLREHLAHRWVRFHSLPGSKRDAETEAEEEILLDRHHEVLAALRGSSTDEVLVVLLRWDGQGAFRASREFRRIASTWSSGGPSSTGRPTTTRTRRSPHQRSSVVSRPHGRRSTRGSGERQTTPTCS